MGDAYPPFPPSNDPPYTSFHPPFTAFECHPACYTKGEAVKAKNAKLYWGAFCAFSLSRIRILAILKKCITSVERMHTFSALASGDIFDREGGKDGYVQTPEA
jgi:hypothetical protein